ncbi:type II toxin-antitoxin system VapC family toxin [Gryllotalpicola protaetiae]|uniref:Ribonuclease VapC n=1 Tax=Gryllotalpicola protaetiae TaxID=2419771 RepID=A0A387BMS2_9MICO|nr:type II toxin-antitoxin system VapC family toxin [Gryllotalpicola protaetiae]AYG03324.1 type II toxin-antitoxin system VapC family toxin [Gryllotalpicola protaetiae]
MILVDTSVWVDHLHRADARLIELLDSDDVATHPMVVAELALGSLANRRGILEGLAALPFAFRAVDDELLELIDARTLWSKGLSAVDAHLLASALITPGTQLWTRDKRLASAAAQLGVAWSPS